MVDICLGLSEENFPRINTEILGDSGLDDGCLFTIRKDPIRVKLLI